MTDLAKLAAALEQLVVVVRDEVMPRLDALGGSAAELKLPGTPWLPCTRYSGPGVCCAEEGHDGPCLY